MERNRTKESAAPTPPRREKNFDTQPTTKRTNSQTHDLTTSKGRRQRTSTHPRPPPPLNNPTSETYLGLGKGPRELVELVGLVGEESEELVGELLGHRVVRWVVRVQLRVGEGRDGGRDCGSAAQQEESQTVDNNNKTRNRVPLKPDHHTHLHIVIPSTARQPPNTTATKRTDPQLKLETPTTSLIEANPFLPVTHTLQSKQHKQHLPSNALTCSHDCSSIQLAKLARTSLGK